MEKNPAASDTNQTKLTAVKQFNREESRSNIIFLSFVKSAYSPKKINSAVFVFGRYLLLPT